MKNALVLGLACLCSVESSHAGRLSMAIGAGSTGGGAPSSIRLDVTWTMSATDTSLYDLDGFDLRFKVRYPQGVGGRFDVAGVSSLPGWSTSSSIGIGGPFEELAFGFSSNDLSGVGISGNGTQFSTVVGSVELVAQGDVAGTEIVFRHNRPEDPLPAAYDGAQIWQLRWQYPVTGPLQFDIGVGNPGDEPPNGEFPYHGYETYQPLIIVPEPGPLAVALLSALALPRFRR